MRLNKKTIVISGITLMIFVALIYFYILPTVNTAVRIVQTYNTRVADSYDYTKRTTPLPQSVIDDICLKFAIGPNDSRCQPGAVVYGPDFFVDIKKYFRDLPRQENIVPIVDEKLGAYFVNRGGSSKDGIYRCQYDLRGDRRYFIGIYFTKEGFFYRIDATTGGS